MKMIKTENLRKIISLSIASAYIKGDKSVSLLIVAKPESGKTATMREFSANNGVMWLSDITYGGLVNVLREVESGKIKTLLIPDMLKVFGRKPDTAKNFLTLLNEAIEEGVNEVRTPYITARFNYARCNVICALTSTDYFKSTRLLGGIGFLSRVIPFSYSYSIRDINEIFKEIIKGNSRDIEFQKLKLNKEKEIYLPKSIAERIKSNLTLHLVDNFSEHLGDEIYGFRLQKNLQTLAKANALLRKSNQVTIKDINELERLSNWINYNFENL
jgi:hypothetical protein